MNALLFENRGKYLYFNFSKEPVDLKRAEGFRDRVLDEIKKSGIKRVLFQVEKSEQLIRLKGYLKIARSLVGKIRGVRAAILTGPELQGPETILFELAMGVFGNRLRFFKDADQAVNWLLGT